MPIPRRRVILTGPARRDINDILEYTELEWGDEQRRRYRTQLRDAIHRIAEMPGLGRARDDLAPSMQAFPADRHLICYRTTESALFVVRILHRRQDLQAIDWQSINENPEETL